MTESMTESCRNSPRSQLVADLAGYLRDDDFTKVESMLADDFVWSTPGGEDKVDRDGLKLMMAGLAESEMLVERLIISTAFSHGKYAAVSSISHTVSGQTFYTHDLFEFTGAGKSAKLKGLVSYVVGGSE